MGVLKHNVASGRNTMADYVSFDLLTQWRIVLRMMAAYHETTGAAHLVVPKNDGGITTGQVPGGRTQSRQNRHLEPRGYHPIANERKRNLRVS